MAPLVDVKSDIHPTGLHRMQALTLPVSLRL